MKFLLSEGTDFLNGRLYFSLRRAAPCRAAPQRRLKYNQRDTMIFNKYCPSSRNRLVLCRSFPLTSLRLLRFCFRNFDAPLSSLVLSGLIP